MLQSDDYILRIMLIGNNVTIKGSLDYLGNLIKEFWTQYPSGGPSCTMNVPGHNITLFSHSIQGYEIVRCNYDYEKQQKELSDAFIKQTKLMAKDLQEPWEDDGDFTT